jgi:two-component sensor histidine kinase/CHASE1-domain containing sensor protein
LLPGLQMRAAARGRLVTATLHQQDPDGETSRLTVTERRLLNAAPLILFLVVLALAGGIAALVQEALAGRAATRFESLTSEIVGRVSDRVSANLALLDGVAALLSTVPAGADPSSFRAYVDRLGLADRHAGVGGIGYLAIRRSGDRAGPALPAGEPMFVPVPGHGAAELRSDLFAEPALRTAMDRARDTGGPIASGPVRLAGADGVSGFIVFRPAYVAGEAPRLEDDRRDLIKGLVFAPFRFDAFFAAILDPSLLQFAGVQVFDGPPEDGVVLHDTGAAAGSYRHVVLKPVQVAGRTWVLRMSSQPPFDAAGSVRIVLPVLGLGLLAAGASALLLRRLLARRLAESNEQRSERRTHAENDLLLQEMKHRTKNVLARVQAVARQTARHTRTTPEFLAAFEARLSAMAATHDLLTRNDWAGADMGELLVAEIQATLGPLGRAVQVDGPPVALDARRVLALGIALHELASNAVRHGRVAESGGDLAVRWRVEGTGRNAAVIIDWTERGDTLREDSVEKGLGTKLIETSIVRELGGKIERRSEPGGFECRIEFPLLG